MSYFSSVKYTDADGTAHGYINNDGAPQICAQDYLQALAEGDIADHQPWFHLGYASATGTALRDVWEGTGNINTPATAAAVDVASDDNAQDIGTVIFSGTASGGSTTSIIDTTKDFSGGTPVAIGDAIILEKSGASPEFGYVTAIVSATELTVSEGFSFGGDADGKTYSIVDVSAHTGVMVAEIRYLDASYVEGRELVIINGTSAVTTVNTDIFKINRVLIDVAGSTHATVGAVSVTVVGGATVYSVISIGRTMARTSLYTVAAGKDLYITSVNFSMGYSTNQTEYARMTLESNQFDRLSGGFRNNSLYIPSVEIIVSNSSSLVNLRIPRRIREKVSIKVNVDSTIAAAEAMVAMRGWLE